MQTGRVYDYAFFILAGLFAAFLLIDFVIDPTGIAFLTESAVLFHKSGVICSPPYPLLAVPYRATAGWLAGGAKKGPGMTSTIATRIATSVATKQSAAMTSSNTTGYTFSAMISR